MSHRWILPVPLLAFGLLFGAWTETAAAQGNEDSEARGLFLAGEAAFEGGRFEEALEHFERSYELSGRPELLYNIGTTAERLRIDARAIEAYEQYLAEIPESRLRANVEGRLRVLREQEERRRAERVERAAEVDASPIELEPEPSDDSPSSKAGLGWGLAAGGFGLLAGGALSLGLAASSRNAATDVDEGTPWVSVVDDAERADRRSGIGIGLLAAGAVLATVGLVLIATGNDDDRLALRIGPGNLALEGSF